VAAFGEKIEADKHLFADFYEREFDQIKAVCGFQPAAANAVRNLKKRGYRVILATNPLFPARATQWRIQWAGLTPEDFELYTTYENSSYCKPNPDYYIEILNKLNYRAEECAMVGNDVTEDMAAETIGMKVFLLTDCIINKENKDISRYPNGGFEELQKWIQNQI